jgi:hypothetical protein
MSRCVFPRPAVAEQDDRLAGLDPGTRREGREDGGFDRGRRPEVELGEALGPREPRLGDPAFLAPALPIVDLCREEFGDVRPMGDPVPDRCGDELVGPSRAGSRRPSRSGVLP